MEKEIIVDINPYQTRVILTEDGAASEVLIERRGRERLVGNIYKGKVQNVLPGMQAAFVDIGLDRNAFLYAGDIQIDKSDFVFNGENSEMRLAQPNIKDMVRTGQDILVQVVKEPVGTKGARVTTHITLPGRTLVLMPTVDYIGVSRRIEDEGERVRLKAELAALKADGIGMIVRTAAAGKTAAEFKADLDFLMRLWDRIQQKSKLLTAPRLIHGEEPLVFRTIRDMFTPEVSRLVINDKEFFEKVQLVAGILSPCLRDRVVLCEEVPDMFDQLGLESAIDKALSHKVWMKNGGYIIIDQTEALTTIDVNTGKYVGSNDNLQETITQTNCEAAREIARQLRLRDISGIIIIDFIDMDEIADKERVLETLRDELKKDRTKSNVLGITQLGLVEMTRKKTRQCISNTLQMPCPYCGGTGKILSRESVMLKVRRLLRCYFSQEDYENYLVRLQPDVANAIINILNETPDMLIANEGKTIWIEAVSDMHMQDYEVKPITSEPELQRVREIAKMYC
ncbi:MAG: Rne/Rng family ribonuclease [Eubacteriales bacterium]|nr:Rne/Rng family ribonuclease [Eubacteriales bacterium]